MKRLLFGITLALALISSAALAQQRSCHTCNGSGHCRSCVGTGKLRCLVCGTSGKRLCTDCVGVGYKLTAERDDNGLLKKETCNSCSGSGKIDCGFCNGSGKLDCNRCNGSGTCTTCQGTGRL